MNTFEPGSLDWLAFRYVAAEMSAAEAAEFETRLADDQTAREAVAAAVDWMTSVLAVGDESHERVHDHLADVAPAVGRASSPDARQAWRSAGNVLAVAASLVLLLALAPLVGRALRYDSDADEARLAAAWSATRSSIDAVETPATEPPTADVAGEATDADDWSADRPMANPPSWLLVGMAGLTAEEESDAAHANSPAPQEL